MPLKSNNITNQDSSNNSSHESNVSVESVNLKEKNESLQKEVDKYKQIIAGVKLAIWDWDLQSDRLIFNEQLVQLIGCSLAEFDPVNSRNTWLNKLHPEDRQKSSFLFSYTKETPFYECEVRVKHKNGEWVRINSKGKVNSWTKTGEPKCVIGSHQEIIESKQEQQQNLFIKEAPTAIAMFDANMCYLAHSKKWIIDFNIGDTNIIGKSHYEVFPEIDDEWRDFHKKCLNGETFKNTEPKEFVRKNGNVQWLTNELRPWYTSTNEVGGIIIFSSDVTHLKNVEDKLIVSEATFRGNFENATVGMGILTLDRKWIEVNDAICTFFGYTADELMQLTFHDLTHPEDLHIGRNLNKELRDGVRSNFQYEKRYIHKNGEVIYAMLFIALVRDALGKPKHLLAQISDITPVVLARERMQATLLKIESIFEASTQVSITATDPTGLITDFNKGAENLLGYTKEEVIFKKTPAIFHLEEEVDEKAKVLSKIHNRKIEKSEVFTTISQQDFFNTQEWTFVRKDGTQFPVQLSVTTIRENGIVTGHLAIAADISKIKEVEKEIKSILQVTKSQNDRLLNFAQIVSHNLKSHTGNFSMLLNLLLKENKEFGDNEIIKMLKGASDNLSETILHLNEVVLMNTSFNEGRVKLNVHKMIEKVLKGVSGIAQESSVKINNHVDTGSHIFGIPAYLESIILNFITNGIKYSAKDRESHVTLSSSFKDDYLILSIEDNGIGIDLNKNGDKLFGMYKTFNHNKDARGIGLFITKNQVESLGGRIEVSSKINKGTTFRIYLKYE